MLVSALAVCLLLSDMAASGKFGASAMHIMEGYLPAGWCIAWGALCIPFLVAGAVSLKRKIAYQGKVKLLIALCAAFVFIISSLKIPSVTGSCSHATGTGLGAILFGPSIMSVLGIIVLLFQAILLAHGGLTTLGANTFSCDFRTVRFLRTVPAAEKVQGTDGTGSISVGNDRRYGNLLPDFGTACSCLSRR